MKPVYHPISEIPGLSQEHQQQLMAFGITNTRELLQKTKTSQLQHTLANQLQLHLHHVKKWVALADLARIPSVGCIYAGLILHSGIASVIHLANTPPQRIHQQILRLQVATMQRRDLCPSLENVQQWTKEAIKLRSSYNQD